MIVTFINGHCIPLGVCTPLPATIIKDLLMLMKCFIIDDEHSRKPALLVIRNSLPDDLRAQQDYESFRQRLKTWLFSRY